MTKHSFLTHNLFGLKCGNSCSDSVSALIEYIYKTSHEHKFVVSIIVDLKKAYDTVNHSILIGKLELQGIHGTVRNWYCFERFLQNRKQRV